MGKTYRRSGDDGDYYRNQKMQRENEKRDRAKKKQSYGEYDEPSFDSPPPHKKQRWGK